MEKYAIRIVDGNGNRSLFAVCENQNGQVYRHRQLASQFIRNSDPAIHSSSWISIQKWNPEGEWDFDRNCISL